MKLKILSLGAACTGCCACMNICEQKAIQMLENEEGFIYPDVDFDICIQCQQCVVACPECNKSLTGEGLIQLAYYGWHTDDQIRKLSSSGGVFSALAESILENNGIVFGSVYNYEKQMVMHQSSEDIDWVGFRKSKYVQSYIGNSFQQIKKNLENGKLVFFIGTPCQVSGLKTYLKKNYAHLLTCDFICHGVPSMKILNEHLLYLEKMRKSKVIHVDFRPKVAGWSKQMLSCSFENGSKYENIHSFEPYFNAFMKNYILRESCYNCKYAARQHQADLTLADFWGYRNYNPEIIDEKGLSLVLVNTEKGKKNIGKLDPIRVSLNPIKWKHAEYVFKERSAENYGMEKRKAFFNDYLKNGYKKTVKQYAFNGTFKSKLTFSLKNKVKALFGK